MPKCCFGDDNTVLWKKEHALRGRILSERVGCRRGEKYKWKEFC